MAELKSNAKKVAAEKPSLKNRGMKLNQGMSIGMPQDLDAKEVAHSLRKMKK